MKKYKTIHENKNDLEQFFGRFVEKTNDFEKDLRELKESREKCKTYIPTTDTSKRCSICGELKYNHE